MKSDANLAPREKALEAAIRSSLSNTDQRPALLVDAAALSPAERSKTGISWTSLALIGCIAIGALAIQLGDPLRASNGAASAVVGTDRGQIAVRLLDSFVAVELTAAGKPVTEIVKVEGGPSRPFVAQLVCGPDEPLADIVLLFGYVGPGVHADVAGLEAGQAATGSDGTFLYFTDRTPPPGAQWSVTAGAAHFEGPVGAWGIRDILGPAPTSACIVSDPSLQPRKP